MTIRTHGFVKGHISTDLLNTLKLHAVEDRDIYTYQEGKLTLEFLLEYILRDGDTLIIDKIIDLGNSTQEMRNNWQHLVVNNVGLVVSSNHTLGTVGKTSVDIYAISKLLFDMDYNSLDLFCSNLLDMNYTLQSATTMPTQSQETKKELNCKVTVPSGRPSIKYPANWIQVHSRWIDGDITARNAMELLNLKRSTFYKLSREYRSSEVG